MPTVEFAYTKYRYSPAATFLNIVSRILIAAVIIVTVGMIIAFATGDPKSGFFCLWLALPGAILSFFLKKLESRIAKQATCREVINDSKLSEKIKSDFEFAVKYADENPLCIDACRLLNPEYDRAYKAWKEERKKKTV